jgi:hypothetical protein
MFTVVVVGILLLLAAKIVASIVIKMDISDYDAIENIAFVSTLLASIATAVIPIGLIYGAISLDELGARIQSALAIAAGIIIGLTGIVSVM